MENMTGLQKAIFLLGSQSALARALGISPQALSVWCVKKKLVSIEPKNYVSEIVKITKGKVTKEELRPDIFC